MKSIKMKMSQQDIKGFMTLQLAIIDYLRGQENNPAYVMNIMLEDYYNKLTDTVPYLLGKREATIAIAVPMIPIFAIGIDKVLDHLGGYEQAIALSVSDAIDTAVAADRNCRARAAELKRVKQELIG